MTAACPVYADRESDLIEEQVWTSQQLDSTYAKIDSLYAQKQQLENEINALDANLINVMVSIKTLENDISKKEEDIKNTKKNIKKAKLAKEKQYEAMKKRIQYLYENGNDKAWLNMIADSDGLADMLNKAENTQKLYEYDRENLEKYSNTVNEIKKLKQKYEQEKAELESMKQEYEAESQNLQASIDAKRASSADCDNEIAYAQQMADEYIILINQQQAEIEQLEAERIAAEQAAAQAAEEQAAMERAAIEQEEEQDTIEQAEEYTENAEASDYENESYEETQNDYEDSDNTDSYSIPSGSSGSSVVDYATQFVGNPYVWGGTSLTNGADCSGFVQSVYSNFGVSLPRTSYEQQNAGTEVSYADAQPGDLICYGGHVAIYMGDGKIVHASNSRDGIKISDNAAYRTITSVRRLV